MKKNNFFKKIVSIFLVFIILFNVIIPSCVYGDDWETVGGVLFKPIKDLVCGISDSVLNLLQNTFVTYNTNIKIDDVYEIRYSPGIIFQGNVPGLDINFIDPGDDTTRYQYFSNWNTVVKVTHVNQETAWSNFQIEVEKYLGYLPNEISSIPGNGSDLNNYNNISFTNPNNGKTYKVYAWRSSPYLWFTIVGGISRIWEHFHLKEYVPTNPSEIKFDITAMIDMNRFLDVSSMEKLGVLDDPSEETGWQYFTISNLEDRKIEFKIKSYLQKTMVQNSFPYYLKVRLDVKNDTGIYTKLGGWSYSNGDILGLENFDGNHFDKEKFKKDISDSVVPYMALHGGIGADENSTDVNTNKSIAAQLKPIISKWYKGTRLIAMVGLLSVLLYVGIRIIISSTAADKAKYKKMLMDWLTALVMLFILHYIMVFILTIAKQINGIFSKEFMDVDPLMGKIRQTAALDTLGDATSVFAATIMYVALVILTVVFTFQYLRRVLYMAFLTMIAPLICLTYPLDKIKDGQAQAFSMWIREYIFNALIQPVHLLIYTMLVGSAVHLMEVSPIYAIIAVSFIVPAEKFIRKMFGFEKASTVGQLGAAAGGAMIMNMINKAKHLGGSPKGSSGGSKGGQSGSKPVRTATPSPRDGSGGSGDSAGETGTSGGGSLPGGGSTENGNSGNGTTSGDVGANAGAQIASTGSGLQMRSEAALNSRRIGGAISAIGHKYKLWGSGAGRQWIRRAGSIVGAGTLGTIGLAAGVATGDLENALKYGGAGLVAGNALGAGIGNMAGNLTDGISGFVGTAKEGYLGEAEYANQQFDKQFYNSSGYQDLSRKYKDRAALREYTQTLLDAGITDTGKMDKAISSGLSAADAVTYNKMAKICPDNIKGDITKFREWYMNNIPNANANDIDRMYNNMKIFS